MRSSQRDEQVRRAHDGGALALGFGYGSGNSLFNEQRVFTHRQVLIRFKTVRTFE